MNYLFLIIFIWCFSKYEAARILAFIPIPSISHQLPFRPLIQELVKRGHEVVVVTTDPAFNDEDRPTNLTEIDIHDVSYKIWNENIHRIEKGKNFDTSEQLSLFFDIGAEAIEAAMHTEQIQKIIKRKSGNFDLLIAESAVLPLLALSHIYKMPVIQMSSFLAHPIDFQHIGVPDHPFLYPAIGRQKLDNLSVFEKIREFYEHYISLQIEFKREEKFIDAANKRHFGSDIPPITELYNNIDMYFINAFPIWDSNRPVSSNVQYVGGMHLKPTKELPQDLLSYLNSSINGVIYISFGSNVDPSSLPNDIIQIFLNVLSRLPYDVIWKWDKDELPGRSENIKLAKWLPQTDLLRHPKIKLFITQGGLQSTDEAIIGGVPMLGIPMFGDQWYNVAMYERHKIGIKLEMESLTEEKLKDAVNALINDDKYRKNIVKLKEVMYDQPQSSLSRAVWWTEYVLRHKGAKHLRSRASNLPWTQYYEIPLVATLMVAAVAAIKTLLIAVCKIEKVIKAKSSAKLKES